LENKEKLHQEMVLKITRDNFDLSQWEETANKQPLEFIAKFEELQSKHQASSEVKLLSLLYAQCVFRVKGPDNARQLCLDNITDAISVMDYERLGQNYLLLAKCYHNTEESFRIKTCFEFALDFAKQSREPHLLATVYHDYATYLINEKAYNHASVMLDTAWKIVSGRDNGKERMDVLMGYVELHYQQQQYPDALSYLTRAYELSIGFNDVWLQVPLMDKLATLYDLTGAHDTASQILFQAIGLCGNIPQLKFKILFNLGTHQMRLGEMPEALASFLETEGLAGKLGLSHPRFLSELNSNIAGCYWTMKDAQRAKEYLDKAMSGLDKMDNPDLAAYLRLNQVHIMVKMGELERAKGLVEDSIEYYIKNANDQGLLNAHQAMAMIHTCTGDYQAATESLLKKEPCYMRIIGKLQAAVNTESKEALNALNKQQEGGNADRRRIKYHGRETGFVGSSASCRKVLDSALLAAQHPKTNVFIFGESGTGKDFLANIIHANSIRRDSPFVAVNISSLSSGVLESELFGHVKGAFTGAINNTKGFFCKSNKGTLFLDEITEIPVEFQAKLLRIVETHKYCPVGSNTELTFDSRIICSTNRDIYAAINSNIFRLDLFHRLNTIEIYIPPLRDRKEDIEEILMYYVESYTRQNNIGIPRISDDFVRALSRYSFPGNVRELKNLVERLFILCGSKPWTENELVNLRMINKHKINEIKSWDNPEVERIINALQQCEGKQKDAAKLLGISESTLCRRIEKYNLETYTQRHHKL